MPLLDIRNLTIEFMTADGPVKAVDRVSMTLSEGEVRGLVGESGSGKSLIAKAICGVTKDNWRVTADRLRFDDIDLLQLTPRERRKLVGHNVSMIFRSRNPVLIRPKASAGSWRRLSPAGPIKATGGSASTGGVAGRLSCCTASVLKITTILWAVSPMSSPKGNVKK